MHSEFFETWSYSIIFHLNPFGFLVPLQNKMHSRNLAVTFPTKTHERQPWASCQIRKIADAHAPGMPGTFSPSPQESDPDMHHGTCVTHVPWCMPGSLYSSFLWNRRRGKRFQHSPRMRNPYFYVSGKRPIARTLWRDMGVFHEFEVWPKFCLRNYCIVCNIVSYFTVIYRKFEV